MAELLCFRVPVYDLYDILWGIRKVRGQVLRLDLSEELTNVED